MTLGNYIALNHKRIRAGELYILLSFVLNRDKASLLAHPEDILSPKHEHIMDQYIRRRERHEPIASITGEKYFFGLPFLVTPDTLIPRPETEILVEKVLEEIGSATQKHARENISLIDIGTGSGCIPISILVTLRKKNPKILSRIQCLAVDLSHQALAVARCNASHHDIHDSLSLQESDLLSSVPESFFQATILILTANLPYLSKAIYDTSPEDVRLYEPKIALNPDESDGTSLIRKLLSQCQKRIPPHQSFFLILEISPEQSDPLLIYGNTIFPEAHLSLVKDLTGRNRFLVIHNT